MPRIILTAYLFIILGCGRGKDFEYNVPGEFEPHVQKFIAEARARGKNITIDNLIIKRDPTLSSLLCGMSNTISSKNDVQKIITIGVPYCWQNDVQLEALIFHELGHCILGRVHDNSLMPKGDPKTMMIPDNISVYSPCVYFTTNCDLLYRRPYYIDELFNPSTPVPDWAK
jgi:hypothetical protein